jgi:hypothetical protein
MTINSFPLYKLFILTSHNSILLDKQINGTIGMDIIDDLMNELIPLPPYMNGVCVNIELDITVNMDTLYVGHYHSAETRFPVLSNGDSSYSLSNVLSYIRSKYLKLMIKSGNQCMPLIINFDVSQINKTQTNLLYECILTSLYNGNGNGNGNGHIHGIELNPGNKYCESILLGQLKNKILITGFKNDYFQHKLLPHIRIHMPNMKTLNYAFSYTMKKNIGKINRPYMIRIYPLMILGYDSKMILKQLLKPDNKVNMCAINFQHIDAENVKNIFRKMYNTSPCGRVYHHQSTPIFYVNVVFFIMCILFYFIYIYINNNAS